MTRTTVFDTAWEMDLLMACLEWPDDQPTLEALGREGVGSVDVMCPGFVSDCLETLEEINMEVREAFLHAGGKEFHYIPCLNDSSYWMEALSALTLRHLQGWPTQALTGAEQTALQAQQQEQLQRARALGAKR